MVERSQKEEGVHLAVRTCVSGFVEEKKKKKNYLFFFIIPFFVVRLTHTIVQTR